MLARIEDFVGSGFPILADPAKASADTFEIFNIYLVDKSGQMRKRIPGSKAARPRLDVVLRELAALDSGQPTAAVATGAGETQLVNVSRPTRPAASQPVVDVRWMWSHDVVRPGDRFKLALLPTVADGFHVYGEGSELVVPFSIEIEVPEGLEQTEVARYPRPQVERDPVLEEDLPLYHGDIPVSAMAFQASYGIDPGDYVVKARLGFQACDDSTCHAPVVREISLPLRVEHSESDRSPVYGWETW